MIWKIAEKEILSNMLTLRFTVGTLLFLSLAVIFSGVLLDDYGRQLENYNRLVSMNDDELEKLMAYQNLKPTVYKPPEILAIFSKGVEENMGNSAKVSIGEVPEIKSAIASKNPLLSVFPVLDIAMVFKLVMSVLAILVAYDAISGEREDGTLRLIMSNSVPRHHVLFGKLMGGMITLAIPIAIGFLMISLILELSPTVDLTGGHWARIALMFLLSLIMVSVLLNLGLFLSSITKRSSDTLIFLLFLWVLFVIVIPNGSAYLAKRIKPIELREKIDSQVKEIWRGFQDELNDFSSRNPWPRNAIQNDASDPWGWYHAFASKNLIIYKQKRRAFSEPLQIKYADRAYQVERIYLDDMMDQKKLAKSISRVSPISVYENLINGLSRTDVTSFESFARQLKEYRQQIIDYLYSVKAFSSIRYFAAVKEEYLYDDSQDEYSELREKYSDPSPLDVSGVPQFHYRWEEMAVTVKSVLPDALILCFMGVLFFMCAFAAFLRRDIK
jgi:ABC-type transport system involved in multi-copper enzyme maturation permease subunit